MVGARVLDLGTCDFEKVRRYQLDLVAERQGGRGLDTLILVEHQHVITLGRSRAARANVLMPGDVPVVEIERGGDATYHGPGQLVGYPVLLLRDSERDLHRYLRNLEEALIRVLSDLGLGGATRQPGATGVWINAHKIASIGIACRKWVTFHGVALNVSTDLAQFARIRPCGFAANVMTSVEQELGRHISLDEVKPLLAMHLGDILGRSFQATSS